MSFAVSWRAFDDRIVIRHAGLLRSARDAVNVGDECDDGFARTIGRDPGGRNSGDAPLDLEAVFLEQAGQIARGFKFLKAEFAKAEDLIDHLLRKSLRLIDFGDRFGLERRKIRRLWRSRRLLRE